MSNFSLVNGDKTRSKTVLKLIYFSCFFNDIVETSLKIKLAKNVVFMGNFHFDKYVQITSKKPFWNKCILHAILGTFWKQLKKKSSKNSVFVRNIHFGKCVQKTGKNRLEIIAFCMSFETLCGDKFEKNVQKTMIFFINFHFRKYAKNVLQWMHFAWVLRIFVETT